MPSIRPPNQPGDARPGNQAQVQARGAWFNLPELTFGADLLSLDATLVDRTPVTPLTPLVPGTYDIHVKSADVRIHADDARAAVENLAGGVLHRHGLRELDVTFRPGGIVRVSGALQRLGVGWPVKLDFRLERRDGLTVAVVPQLNPLARWTLDRLGVDFAREAAAHLPGSRRGPGGTLLLDVRQVPFLHTQVQALATEAGTLRVTLGAAGVKRPPEVREGAKHWLSLDVRGEVSIPDGNLRDGRVFARSTDGARPIHLNAVPSDVTLRRDGGDVVITRESVITALKARVPRLQVSDARFEGDGLHVTGVYEVPAAIVSGFVGLMVGGLKGFRAGSQAGVASESLKIPVRETIRVSVTPDGNLRLAPTPDSYHADIIRDRLADLVGARADGDGAVLDFSRLGELEVGRIRSARVERGQLVLKF